MTTATKATSTTTTDWTMATLEEMQQAHSQGKLPAEAFERYLALLTAENTRLKNAKPSGGLKISAKGALSAYGLGRFPVTLYPEQWIALLDRKEEILGFIEANKANLKFKAPKDA